MTSSHSARRWTARLTVLLLLAACLSGMQIDRQFAAAARAATTARPHLLLIHGYTDSCEAAFNSYGSYSWSEGSNSTLSTTEANDTTTYSYLTGNTGWTSNDITTVGYYNHDYGSGDGGDSAAGVCDVDLNGSSAGSWANDTVNCNLDWQPTSLPSGGGNPFGTTYDPIMHLGCLFAWYIYDTYTKAGVPVEILAHSMGGLVTRAAVGGSSAGAAGFPPALSVPDVVTVATPQGGIGGIEATAAWWSNQGSEEVADMQPGSTFMNLMGTSAYEKPQGTGGTHWALIGSSVPSGPPASTTYAPSSCVSGVGVPATWSLARVLSCLQEGIDSDTYPDGDGVVNAMSQMAMAADYKVLYGAVEDVDVNVAKLYIADTSTEYEHETRSCQGITGGPPRNCTQAPFYLNDGLMPDPTNASTYTKAFVCRSSCTATDFSDLSLGSPTTVPHSLAEIASQLPAPTAWVVGHAANAGDDYPYETVGQFGHTSEGTDAWNEFYGQCDSFAAWKAYENLAGAAVQRPTGSIPAVGWKPSNASVSPVNQFTWGPNGGKYGNADVWASKFASLGYAVNDVPSPGSIAWWPNAVTDPQDGNPPDPVSGIPGSSTGHVGFVSDVYPDGSITVEQYNMRENGEYSVVHLAYGQGYTDNSFSLSNFYIPWPGKFIHVADGAGGQASPAEPAAGVVQSGYAGQSTAYSSARTGLTVIGPGDGAADFTLAGSAYTGTTHGWYSDAGHGEIGQMLWTNTHPGAADSTATWSPRTLSANACYRVDALVPDNWSNNDAAQYVVSDQHFGNSRVPVDENSVTNDWAELGIFESHTDGSLSVELTDQGSGTGQIAADAMRYIKQSDCSGLVRASQTIDYSNGMQLAGQSYSGTINGWYANSGSGQLGNQYYTYTNGMTPGSSATWTANVMAGACYELFAYVPGNHANDYQAMYSIASAAGTPTVSVDANSYTNAFAALGTYRSTSAGEIVVILTDQSLASSDAFVTADTLSFVHIACPAAVQGSTYPALTEGPGSPLTQFSLGSDWYSRFGHGDLGYEKWTNTHGSTAVSTAKWTFAGLPAKTAYSVCAFIPDNYADNTAAHYQGFTGSSATATFTASLNQANLTGWSYVGTLATDSTGTVHVTLDDTGPTGTYTAADALRLSTSGC